MSFFSSRSYIPDYLTNEIDGYTEPVLIFDLVRARQKIKSLKSLEGQHNCKFLYATKACAEKEILSPLVEEGIGFDVSNQNELDTICAAVSSSSKEHFISATSPCCNNITDLDSLNVIFANSTTQWEMLNKRKMNNTILGLRVAFAPRKSYTSHTNESRFGVSIDDLKQYKPAAIHIHQSGGKSTKVYDELINFLKNLIADIGYIPEIIDLGGGAYYFSLNDIEKLLLSIREEIPFSTKIIFEFGYYWFAECGYAIGKVIDRNDELPSVSLDLSMECHLKWSVPIPLDALETNDHTTRNVIFYGSTCYEGDCLGAFSYPRSSSVADLFPIGKKLLFEGVDIYSISWNHSFNGVQKAKIKYISVN